MKTETVADEARALLRGAYGPAAQLREGQLEAIESLLAPGARRLLVQSTGWGKSVVYFIAGRLLRDRRHGTTLVVSPLISLMRNQVAFAQRFGLRAAAVHSENHEAWADIEDRLSSGEVDVLFVSPERLHVPDFRERILNTWIGGTALVVIDEAHCVSEWGHDFRPEYRTILRQLDRLPKTASILAATATATPRVEEDLRRIFGPFLEVQRGQLVRRSLRLVGLQLSSPAAKLAWLERYLPRMPGPGIVYGLTVFDVKEVDRWLRGKGIESRAYYAELGAERRIELEEAFSRNEIQALVATTALGMGYDKADVGFVIHYQMPSSLISYYQQIGRAGRAMDRAYAVLLGGGDDDAAVIESFVQSARPPDLVFEAVISALQGGRRSFAELAHDLSLAPTQVRHVLDILDAADALIESQGRFGVRTDAARQEMRHGDEIRALRRREFAQVRAYLDSPRCRMQSVAEALGDFVAEPCGNCDRCKPVPPPKLDPEVLREAELFLRGEAKVLVPRTRIPFAIPGRKQTLSPDEVCLAGIVLGVYGDGQWGPAVRDGKYRIGHYSDELVEAAADAVRTAGHRIDGLAWVPSSKPESPLGRFVERLAENLGIPAREVVVRRGAGPPQKSMSAGHEQFMNVWNSLEVEGRVSGTWLLVDDIVDSGWTLAVAGMRLRQAGASAVVPLALAAASTSRIRFRDEEGST